MEEYLNVQEAAAYLGRPVKTLYQWRYVGYGPKAGKMGNKLAYRRSELDRWALELEREGELSRAR